MNSGPVIVADGVAVALSDMSTGVGSRLRGDDGRKRAGSKRAEASMAAACEREKEFPSVIGSTQRAIDFDGRRPRICAHLMARLSGDPKRLI
jgi:hypothetical protein